MKATLCPIITLLTLITLAFPPNSFAQDASPEYVVRQIYFHPSDRQPSQEINARLDVLVDEVQQFYADEMESHGFDRKTFRLETDALGKPVRHYAKGRFPSIDYSGSGQSEREILNKIEEELSEYQTNELLDVSGSFVYLIFFVGDDFFTQGLRASGVGAGWSFGGGANITLLGFHKAPEDLDYSVFNLIAHELGHAFGLSHDFRDDRYMMSYGNDELTDQLSYCAAEWLDVHRYFNTTRSSSYQVPTIEMLPPSFVSPPNTIRLRFEITHTEKLHQAQLLQNSHFFLSTVNPVLFDYKSLNGNEVTIEFITTELTPVESRDVVLRVIDTHGNFTDRNFPIDIAALLPDSEPMLMPDPNLAAAIRINLGLAPGIPITKLDMLSLRRLELHSTQPHMKNSFRQHHPEKQITDLTGLEHATNLEHVELNGNQIVDLTPLAELTQLKALALERNRIRDISSLAGLTQLSVLMISNNQITDISPLAGLTRLTHLGVNYNPISDHTPLKELTNLSLLELYGNQITDETLPLLTKFPKLASLFLGGNQIRDIAPLTKLTRLGHLFLESNQISDITPLAGLTNLQVLDLIDNQISDITPLTELTYLRTLQLSHNQISDVSSLSGLVNLEVLGLIGNPIKNRKPLLALLRKNPDVEIWLNNDKPLPVTLSHFRAERTDAGVILKWITQSEVDNAGFYIHRSETRDGKFKIVNPTMIQGAGTTSERSTYTWTDTTAKPNTVYYYRIEDISHAGVRKQLATVRMRGFVSASGKLTTRWADLKVQD